MRLTAAIAGPGTHVHAQPATRCSNEPLGGSRGDWRHRLFRFHLPMAIASAAVVFLWLGLPIFRPTDEAAEHQMPMAAPAGQIADHRMATRAGTGHQMPIPDVRAPGDAAQMDHSSHQAASANGSLWLMEYRGLLARFTTATGYVATGLLALKLLIGPTNLLLRKRNPISSYFRRDVGIWTAIVSVVHVIAGLQVHGPAGPLGERILRYFFARDGSPLLDTFGLGNWTGRRRLAVAATRCSRQPAASVSDGVQGQVELRRSAWRAQSGQCHANEPANCRLGAQAAGCFQGVKAVARELVGRDILPDVAARRTLGDQLPDEVVEPLPGLSDVLALVQERPELGDLAAPAGVQDVGVGVEDGLEPLTRTGGPVPDLRALFEVRIHVAVVPGDEDRLDVQEVLVERRASDAGLLGDSRHRHRMEPVLGHQATVASRIASPTSRRCAWMVARVVRRKPQRPVRGLQPAGELSIWQHTGTCAGAGTWDRALTQFQRPGQTLTTSSPPFPAGRA